MRSRYRCSMCPAIHINSRSWLRSSSTHEPSDPPLRVVSHVIFTLPWAAPSGVATRPPQRRPGRSRHVRTATVLSTVRVQKTKDMAAGRPPARRKDGRRHAGGSLNLRRPLGSPAACSPGSARQVEVDRASPKRYPEAETSNQRSMFVPSADRQRGHVGFLRPDAPWRS